ncbi:hypothetical protein ORJ00_10145 [Rheinheimera baltica]|uniref:secretin N-terminal domain-containing protein n=1 Tax=Rheinheimera baltica TaxID=67576 RepID=UPI00273DEBBF|nr:secretin N-terminal domain-containing protein [Rheinheimera baltica]MDP5143104.1 hypothetical protein [Rheinheimera baltica]
MNMFTKKTLVLACSAVLMAGCASTPDEKDKPLKASVDVPKSFLQKETSKTAQNQYEFEEKAAAETGTEQIQSMAQLKNGSPLLLEAPKFASEQPMKIAVNEMELPQLAHYVFGELLKLDYILSADVERMRDRVALNIQSDITPQRLYSLTTELLAKQNVEVYSKDNIVFVNKQSNASANRSVGIGRRLADMPAMGDDIIQLVPYTFNSARSIMQITNKLSKATVTPDNSNRLLLVEGSRADVERVLQVVDMMDVPHARGRDIRLITMTYLSPDEMLEEINKLMGAEGINTTEDVLLVPLGRLNAVVVYAANPTLGNRVSMWAKKLDVATGGENERYFVYRPDYVKAADLAKSISMLGSGGAGESSLPAGAPTSRGSGAQDKKFSMSADEKQNAIIVHATPSKFQEVLALLKQLDRLPGQIALQVVIVDVTLEENEKRGIDWTYNSNANAARSATGNLTSGTGLMAFNAISGDWTMNFNLQDSQKKTNLLARPYLVVRDGESATINAGDQIPIITQTSSNDTNPDVIRNQVQYRSTGISLSVTPTINADGLISLEISTESSKSDVNSLSNISSPIITTRSVSTSILAGSGQTVVLGGLINENIDDNENSVPLLGKIPLLRHLFTSKSKGNNRQELMILITPRIISESSELDELGTKLSEMFSFPVNQ